MVFYFSKRQLIMEIIFFALKIIQELFLYFFLYNYVIILLGWISMKNSVRIMTILFVMIMIVLSMGYSFAYVVNDDIIFGNNTLIVTDLDLNLVYSEEIKLGDMLPTIDKFGIENPSFDFVLTNNSEVIENYVIRLVDGKISSTLPNSNVRYSLVKNDERLEPRNLTDSGSIDSGSINPHDSVKYSLTLWVDGTISNAPSKIGYYIKTKSVSGFNAAMSITYNSKTTDYEYTQCNRTPININNAFSLDYNISAGSNWTLKSLNDNIYIGTTEYPINSIIDQWSYSEEKELTITQGKDLSAENVIYDNAESGLEAGNVQEAINEINSNSYIKPAEGIPASDLTSDIQESLEKADTALQSYTETDPIFTTSAAHDITLDDIANWNNKAETSDIPTVTDIYSATSSDGMSGKAVASAINDIVEIAEGKTTQYVVNDADNTVLNSDAATITITSSLTTILGKEITLNQLKIGDIILITETDVPDRWVGLINSSTSEEGTTVSSVVLYKMETSKINLSEYATQTDLDNKMDKENPTGTGSFSLNRKAETTVGDYSFAEGYQSEASGSDSHAEGSGTKASGYASHTEGYQSIAEASASHAEGYGGHATGEASHSEGFVTSAHGNYSHAEGHGTSASGVRSHVEGYRTDAYGDNQHVQGMYNKPDYLGKYAHIVGGGTAPDNLKNIHTLDWDGNAEFAGDVTATATDGTKTSLLDLKKSVSDGKSSIASAITAQGVTTASDAAFSTMATNIGTAATNKYNAGANAVYATQSTTTGSWNGATYTASSSAGYKASSTSTTITTQAARTVTSGQTASTIFSAGSRVYFSGALTLGAKGQVYNNNKTSWSGGTVHSWGGSWGCKIANNGTGTITLGDEGGTMYYIIVFAKSTSSSPSTITIANGQLLGGCIAVPGAADWSVYVYAVGGTTTFASTTVKNTTGSIIMAVCFAAKR